MPYIKPEHKMEERIEAALDVLKEICDSDPDDTSKFYDKRAAAEEILRHYREMATMRKILEEGITININGAIPVRPKTVYRGDD